LLEGAHFGNVLGHTRVGKPSLQGKKRLLEGRRRGGIRKKWVKCVWRLEMMNREK
jgi:hypothetical protein